MDYNLKLRQLEMKVARLELKHIQHKGLSGFVEYMEEIKKDLVDEDYTIASQISGYYSNLDDRMDKALGTSIREVTKTIEKVRKQIHLYDRAIVSFNKYKDGVGGTVKSPEETVYNSPFREADIVLRMSTHKQAQMIHDIKSRLESVLQDLKNMQQKRPLTAYNPYEAEGEHLVRNLPRRTHTQKRYDR